MPFIDLPESAPPTIPEEFSFHTTNMTLEELARTSILDFFNGEDPLNVEAIWTQSFNELNTRRLERDFMLTARFSESEDSTPALSAMFLAPVSNNTVNFAEVTETLDEMTRLAQTSFRIRRRVNELLAPWKASARGNRERRPDSAYAALAMRYVQLVDSKVRNPRQALSEELGLSLPSISARVREARSYGFLTESAHGRAEGVLTDKARLALDKAILSAMKDR